MMMDIDQATKATREEGILAEIEDFIEGFNQPTYRGMRVNGVGSGSLPGHSEMGGPGIAGRMRSGSIEPLSQARSAPRLIETAASCAGLFSRL
jgi:hypothetical protein